MLIPQTVLLLPQFGCVMNVGRNTVSKQDQLNAASHPIQISEDVRIVF
jgi:hypothetical protein